MLNANHEEANGKPVNYLSQDYSNIRLLIKKAVESYNQLNPEGIWYFAFQFHFHAEKLINNTIISKLFFFMDLLLPTE